MDAYSMSEFITARLDERKVIAQDAVEDGTADAGPWVVGSDTAEHLDPHTVFRPGSWRGHLVHACNTDLAGDEALPVARHIASNDPARVIAQIEATRKIIANARTALDQAWQLGEEAREATAYIAVRTLQHLADLDADHPDYDPAWQL